MKKIVLFALAILVRVPCQAQWIYPSTKAVDASDTFFGKTYQDPYRWLEDLNDPSVTNWFKAQAELTDGLLAKIPGREALVREWLQLDKLKPATYSEINCENGRVFYKKTLGGENVGKLYFRHGWNGAEKLLFDPDTYKTNFTTTIGGFVPSWDGKHVALTFSSGRVKFPELRILDVQTGKLLPERLYPSGGALGWLKNNRCFFHLAPKFTDVKSPEIDLHLKTKVHVLGTDFAADRDIFSDESNPELGITAIETPSASIDESYPDYLLGFCVTAQTEMRVFYAPAAELKHGKIGWKELCKTSDNLVRGMEFYGNHVYAATYADAPKYKLVRTDIQHSDWAHAETVIPEARDSIQSITKSRDYLLVAYSDGIVGRLVKYNLVTGKTAEVKLPAAGILSVSCPDLKKDRYLVNIKSWTLPPTTYEFDARKDTFAKSIFNSDVTYPGFDQLVSEEVEVPGHDGTLIPLSIIHRKDLALDGSNSCILNGYGAYGISLTPRFDIKTSVALQGVVMAVAHVRGGGEKGEAWYRAGYKTTKPNTWKDFISCAQYLVQKEYTSPHKLAGSGTSAGGILIGRAITERPDLFAAAVCNVGCPNTMRDGTSSNAPANYSEFGTVKDPVECQALYEMDGVQHVQKDVPYPAVLGVAGWNDPRVPPWQPGKFVAAMQAATASGKPVLLKVNYDNGHFTEEKIVSFKNFADQFAFMLWQTGHKDFQPVN